MIRAPGAPLVFIFDWDNTLVDTHDKGIQCSLLAMRTVGVEVDREVFRKRFAPDYHAVYRSIGIPESQLSQIDEAWLRFYAGEVRTQLFPDARPALDVLTQSGHQLAIVTTGQRHRVYAELAELGLQKQFAQVICREDVQRVKPEPDAVLAIQQAFPSARRFLLVGDHPDDMEMARRAGVESRLIVRSGDPASTEHRITSLLELVDPAQPWFGLAQA